MATLQVKKDGDLVAVKRGAVFGSGAFGTALATVLAKTCEQVTVWHMNEKQAQEINQKHENVYFLKGPKLAENIVYTSDVKKTLDGADIILFVIPTQFMRGFLKQWGSLIKEKLSKGHIPVLVCTKGIERSTLKFPAQIVEEFLPEHPVSVLAGPSFAIEVAKGMYTNVCVASHNIEESRYLQRVITTPDRMFRCWATTDTIGCEVASAVKNVLAIASGVASGLGMGLNARAALITRGLLEIRDLSAALGGNGSAIFGLAGLGDLLLTCSSELSRNFSVGYKLGKGQSFEEIMRKSKAVAEGVATAQPLFHLAKKKRVNMPICEQVYRVVYENKKAIEAFATLRDMGLSDEGLPPLSRAAIRQTSPWAHL